MPETGLCPGCGTELSPALLTCPSCRRLVHGGRLRELADEAAHAEAADDPTAALVAWRSALELLPRGSKQYETITARVNDLAREVDSRPAVAAPAKASADGANSGAGAGAAGLGALALVLWKLKAVGFILLTKGKLLLLGLTKAGTLSSMFLSMGIYATALGWKFALGFILSIYVHEMGHVAALLRYGVKASAPMFVPGVGALIRMMQPLGDARQDARVGLAGPAWGLAAAVVAHLGWRLGGGPVWGAVAHFGAAINLFNLMPFGPLDGGRAFNALSRPQRWFAVMVVAAAWSFESEELVHGFLTLIMLVGAVRAVGGKAPARPDRGALLAYCALIAALTGLAAMTPVPAFPN